MSIEFFYPIESLEDVKNALSMLKKYEKRDYKIEMALETLALIIVLKEKTLLDLENFIIKHKIKHQRIQDFKNSPYEHIFTPNDAGIWNGTLSTINKAARLVFLTIEEETKNLVICYLNYEYLSVKRINIQVLFKKNNQDILRFILNVFENATLINK